MNSIEEKLWEYIDGSCTPDEHKAISLLIEQDKAYRQKYMELLAFNQEIAAMDMEEPSMAFTYKVMENIRADYAKQPLKAAITPGIIKGIGGFFIITVTALVVFLLASVNWSAGGAGSATTFQLTGIKTFLSGPI